MFKEKISSILEWLINSFFQLLFSPFTKNLMESAPINTFLFVKRCYRISIYLMHLAGTVLMVTLSIASLGILWYVFAGKLGVDTESFKWLYDMGDIAVKDKVVWAATTILFVTTVSIRHLWNYEINQEKLFEEKMERYRNELNKKYDDINKPTQNDLATNFK